jgi:hypothetical protein
MPNTSDPAHEPKPLAASDRPGDRLRLVFTGDVCLGSGLLDAHPGHGVASLLAPLGEMLGSSDLAIGNLEFAVAPAGRWDQPRRGAIAVERHRLAGLGKSGFQVFSIANNHVMDAGPDGLRSTLRLLREEGLACLGAGETYDNAVRPLVLEVRGRRVGLLAACDWSAHFARRDVAGIAPLQRRALEQRVADLRGRCDLVVVLLHADLEFTPHPAPWRVRLARRLVERGADAVIQHHPHVIQGWERWRGGLIAYSLGNFVFRIQGNPYQALHAGTLDGLVLQLQVEFDRRGARLTPEFVPVRIGADHLPSRPCERDSERILGVLQALSAQLREPGRIRAVWRRRSAVETRRLAYGMYLDAAQGRLVRALRAPWRALAHPEDRRWLLGWLTAGYR